MTTTGDRSAARNDDGTPADRIVVELDEVATLVAREAMQQAAERAARSLFQTPMLGAVVTAIRDGGVVHNDDPDEAATIQGLRGESVISMDGKAAVIRPGTFVAIPAGVPWRLVARTDAVVLLTISGS